MYGTGNNFYLLLSKMIKIYRLRNIFGERANNSRLKKLLGLKVFTTSEYLILMAPLFRKIPKD